MATHSTILVWKTQWTGEPGEYGPWGHKESNKTEQLNTHTHACTRTHTHTYTHILYIHTYIYIYTLFCIFFPIMVYHGILNIVPCVIQQDVIVYPKHLQSQCYGFWHTVDFPKFIKFHKMSLLCVKGNLFVSRTIDCFRLAHIQQ